MNGQSQVNLLSRLRYGIDSYSPKLKAVADFIVSNADKTQYLTITELARHTITSEATVIRLCRDLGFKGYSDFRMALAIEISQQQTTNINNEPNKDADRIDDATNMAITSLQDTSNLIDRKQIDRICKLIHEADNIHCVGVGASSIVGHYLSFRLTRIGKYSTMFEDTHMAAMRAIKSKPNDLWFAISSSGSTKDVVYVATKAKSQKSPVVSLTNIRHSPLSVTSDEILVAARPEGPLSGGAFASKVSALLLVDILINQLVAEHDKYAESVKVTAEVTMAFMV
ncbi:MurR/RpiR family transcriptional regulator [Vibrio metschnikovii]|uniref:MurR/RpiR family transcriptional regulator n=1 Tax=Vibrio metschnikovii TaxID=28172 RepID=UPI00165D989B|nr:MurR/RpiR family transcriptional regulator [Vibrio metschnikovii]EKO3685621.1 MurR/RpiR family transcriptional regulator [Vibrio metschnikovii]EKO3689002.1 MurR/RpiR family transcriptional regulator [Vibrio metschnikovii]EKO3781136.1 MurR/RpiR family transcriptional regulator [Vibrio metschnikovii]EKO3888122.1 MurR/RpiR family transcriptional regulator [Vibrio metschnikovii]EKO3936738.1 MurR/RpiR family transcriptional regulator [Vibrio metschnikovii]